MNLLLTTVFENGFQEIYLPNVSNKTVPIDIKPYISGCNDDITLPLEVWDDVWQLSGSRQFVINENQKPVPKVTLKPGMLLNCDIRENGSVFSVTVNEASKGNTAFNKYILNPDSVPCVSIGSEEGNVVRFADKFCSPRHAEITFRNGQAFVLDKNSVNGTFVNGRLLTGERPLGYGDVVYIIGLKIVYLGNVLAINNPKDEVTVVRIKPVHIKAGAAEDDDREDSGPPQEEYFLRTARKLERLDTETFTVEKCPQKQQQKQQPLLFTVGPAFTMVIPMAVGGIMAMGDGGSGALGGIIMSAGAAGIGALWAVINTNYQKKEATETENKRVNLYTDYLTKMTGRIREKMEYNRTVLKTMYPAGDEIIRFGVGASPRLWERSTAHDDFLTVRVGLGDIPSPNAITLPKDQAMAERDPLNDKTESIVSMLSTLERVPVELSLFDNLLVGVVSANRDNLLLLANALAVQIAGLHPYTDVRMCFVYPSKEQDAWEYAKWLPHSWAPDGKLRMLCCDRNTVGDVMFFLSGVIRDRLERAKEAEKDAQKVLPHYVVMVSDLSLLEEEPVAKYLLNPQAALGITVLLLVDSADKLPAGCSAIIRDDADSQGFYSTLGTFPARDSIAVEKVPTEQIEKFARSLSGIHVRETNVSSAVPDMLTFLDMYRTSSVEDLDMLHRWLENRTYESMKSMVGYKAGSQPLYLDIHEKFHGPHGLVAGTTGSGKSETLQSYIASLVVNYHPHEVAFILIDYKGGGMAQSFIGLPHLSGVITNLGGNATNRALLSINAEIKSRQRIFNEYKVKHIDAYIELYRTGVASEPMPHLLIIADEFAELKKEQPEFVRALVSAARVGRSLGVNLILATQKPSGVVDDEIWSNTRFRLCLRVADKSDSNEMIKRPDAAFITGTGRGYFQVGNDEIFEEFQSGWSGAPYEPEVPFTDDKNIKVELINLLGKSGVPKKKKEKKSDNITSVTQLDAVVKYAAKIAGDNGIPAIKQIWLPPLPKKLYLDELDAIAKPEGFSLLLPIGLGDSPETQSQYPVCIDFRQDGHLVICGPSGSGKTTLLQTILYSAVTRYPARELNLYIADFSSRTMAVFGGLPQVGGVVFEGDDDAIAKIFELLAKTLQKRKEIFSAQGIGSFKEYVTQHDDCPAIVFAIDNFVAFNESYEQYEDTLVHFSREAASYGIYLVFAISNQNELRTRIRQNITTGLALQMPDRYEYEAVIGDRTEIVPEGRTAGRGLMKYPLPLEFQTALCVREEGGASQAQTLRKVFEAMKQEMGDEGVRKIDAAEEKLVLDGFLARPDVRAMNKNQVGLGLTKEDGKLVSIDLNNEFCYIVGGGPGTGKTNMIAALAKQAKARGLRVFLFDGADRELGALAEAVDGYATDDASLFPLMQSEIVPLFKTRLGKANAAREAGGDVAEALGGEDGVLILINSMPAFVNAVYSESMNMSGFFESALQKGRQLKIGMFAAITSDDSFDLMDRAAMRLFVQDGRGMWLGGLFDQQSMLRFELSMADSVRQLEAGFAFALDGKGVCQQIATPLAMEQEGKSNE